MAKNAANYLAELVVPGHSATESVEGSDADLAGENVNKEGGGAAAH